MPRINPAHQRPSRTGYNVRSLHVSLLLDRPTRLLVCGVRWASRVRMPSSRSRKTMLQMYSELFVRGGIQVPSGASNGLFISTHKQAELYKQ